MYPEGTLAHGTDHEPERPFDTEAVIRAWSKAQPSKIPDTPEWSGHDDPDTEAIIAKMQAEGVIA